MLASPKRSTVKVATHLCKNLSTRESHNDKYQLLVIINLHILCVTSFQNGKVKLSLVEYIKSNATKRGIEILG